MLFGRPFLHWSLLLSLVVMWGSSFLVQKIAVTALPPDGIVAARLVIAAALLLGFALATGKRMPPFAEARAWKYFALMAVFGNALPFFLIAWGQRGIDSGLAGILMAVMPLSTILLAHFFVPGERLNPAKSIGFAFGFCGIVILIGPEALLQFEGGGTALISQLSVLGGAVCYAINSIIARHRPAGDPLVGAAGVMLVGSVMMAPVATFSHAGSLPEVPFGAGLAVLVLGVISTAVATVVFLRLIALAGPSFLSLINYLIPLWAVLVGMLFLGEEPRWNALAALALILGGIALAETLGKRR